MMASLKVMRRRALRLPLAGAPRVAQDHARAGVFGPVAPEAD
ncbi:hypothetical protein [Paraburkholderia sp. Ac-20347]|jgi:hypothetical protein|nr:hypothetical protein [Paraburkholderia sp. Ac-20347]